LLLFSFFAFLFLVFIYIHISYSCLKFKFRTTRQPEWLAAAATTTLSLKRISDGADFQIIPEIIVHFARGFEGQAPVFEFEEAWAALSTYEAKALGGSIITVTGEG
jgi:hypothetical protein